ncbi:uncharacterized protein LOC129295789 isoform X1 [Prosopis cineraria]|uniref:uncharacterized protein LOC129295789 isoform X1 n=1 Tax=Prosopis cineraria TaxID=364024 RepID=UPI00240FBEF5|nr:uncharacterized protein LOC129295789 isoform X1 [Prosopis cineraria]
MCEDDAIRWWDFRGPQPTPASLIWLRVDGEWLTRGLKWREQNLKQGVVRAQEPASGCTLLHFKSGKSAPSRNTPSMFRRNNNVGGGFGSSSGLSLIFSSLFEIEKQ